MESMTVFMVSDTNPEINGHSSVLIDSFHHLNAS